MCPTLTGLSRPLRAMPLALGRFKQPVGECPRMPYMVGHLGHHQCQRDWQTQLALGFDLRLWLPHWQ